MQTNDNIPSDTQFDIELQLLYISRHLMETFWFYPGITRQLTVHFCHESLVSLMLCARFRLN